MLRKRLMLFIPILIVIVAGFLFLRPASKSPPASVSPDDPSAIDPDRAAEIAQYPMLDKANRESLMNQPVSSWEEWVRVQAEVRTGSFFSYEPFPFTPEEYSEEYKRRYIDWTEIAEGYQRQGYPVPTDGTHSSIVQYKEPRRNLYEGPQTVEAIMAALDHKYENSFPRAAEMEATYPRESFLQRVLDEGAVIREYSDYEYWMKQRDMLLYRKDRPKDWQSGGYGIPITTDFSVYEEGFLERKVWENNIINQVSEANPGKSVYVYFPSSHPDVYLPSIGKMTYVRRSGSITNTMGTMLTDAQRDNLIHKGIEPEDIEIVYIDEDYNVLSEAPPLWPKFDIDPDTNQALHNGIPVTPENYESLVGHPMPAEMLVHSPSDVSERPPSDASSVSDAVREAAREAALSAAREAAKSEYEKFSNRIRQFEEFSTMSDAEIAKSLERQFRQKFLPEHPVEQLTPERLEEALGLLFQHGFDEGFRRIKRDSPVLANQLERYFGGGQKPPPGIPKGPPSPVPPKPSETSPASETE